MKDYYLLKISLAEICEKEGIYQSTFYRRMEKNNYIPRRKIYGQIDTGNLELNQKLKSKYAAIVKRCNGGHTNNYKGLEYLNLIEWVKFCNQQKEKLNTMWNKYIEKKRDKRYTISIDRIDNSKGYLLSNIEFVIFGFNAWKRNIRPIKIKFNNKWHYFMSAKEGARFFDVRRQSMGDLLRGEYREISKEYTIKESAVKDVLAYSKENTLKNYYKKYILKERDKNVIQR